MLIPTGHPLHTAISDQQNVILLAGSLRRRQRWATRRVKVVTISGIAATCDIHHVRFLTGQILTRFVESVIKLGIALISALV